MATFREVYVKNTNSHGTYLNQYIVKTQNHTTVKALTVFQ